MVRRVIDYVAGNAFARNSLVLFSGTMIANVVNYLFHVVIGRMVDVHTYGEIESLIALMTIVSVPALTLTMIATRFAAQMFARTDHASTRVLIAYLQKKVFLYGGPLLVVAFGISPLVRDFLKLESVVPIYLLWLAMFGAFFVAIVSGVLTGWQRFRDAGLLNAYAAIAKLLFSVAFISIGFSVSGVVGSLVLANVIAYGFSLIMLRFIVASTSHDDAQQNFDLSAIKSYTLPVFIGSLAITALGNMDMVFAKNALDGVASGQYGALSVIGKIIYFATGVIATVLFSMSSGSGEDTHKSHRVFYNSFALTLLCGLIALGAYFLVPELIISILFGAKYLPIAQYLGWFGLLAVLYSLANLLLQYLLSIQVTRIVYYYIGLTLVSAVVLAYFTHTFHGILSVMIVTQALVVCVGMIFVVRVGRRLKSQ